MMHHEAPYLDHCFLKRTFVFGVKLLWLQSRDEHGSPRVSMRLRTGLALTTACSVVGFLWLAGSHTLVGGVTPSQA